MKTTYLLVLMLILCVSCTSCDHDPDNQPVSCDVGYAWDPTIHQCVYELQIGQALALYAPSGQCYQLDLNGDGVIENELWDLGGHKGSLEINLNTATSRVAIVTYVTAFPQVPYCNMASGQITGIVGYFYW